MTQPPVDRFWLYAGLVVVVGVLGVVAAVVLPTAAEHQAGALVGTVSAGLSGLVALPLKRRAVERSMKAALMALGAVFGLRVVLVAVGLVWVKSQGGGVIAFTAGFFGVYLVLQWLEVSFVMAERSRRGPEAQ